MQSLPKGSMGLQESEITGIGQEVFVEVQLKSGIKKLETPLFEGDIHEPMACGTDLHLVEHRQEKSLRLHESGQIDLKTFGCLRGRQGDGMTSALG